MKKYLLGACLLVNFAFAKEIILVQGAMDMEVDYLVEQLQQPTKKQIGGWTFWEGKIGNKQVVVSRTEVGLTNAAASTAIGIETFSPTLIINQGTSGGHDNTLHAGDIVLGEKIINMGSMKSNRKEVHEPANYKDYIFMDVVQKFRNNRGEIQDNPYFSSNEALMKQAEALPFKYGKVVRGIIGTADQWNRELERIHHLHKTFNTSVEEMESVASAQVASAFRIPFIAVRILSNAEEHQEDFNPKTALWCQEYVVDFIKSMK